MSGGGVLQAWWPGVRVRVSVGRAGTGLCQSVGPVYGAGGRRAGWMGPGAYACCVQVTWSEVEAVAVDRLAETLRAEPRTVSDQPDGRDVADLWVRCGPSGWRPRSDG